MSPGLPYRGRFIFHLWSVKNVIASFWSVFSMDCEAVKRDARRETPRAKSNHRSFDFAR
jgi:hypothetical protein